MNRFFLRNSPVKNWSKWRTATTAIFESLPWAHFHHFPQLITLLQSISHDQITTTSSETRERSEHQCEERVEEPEKALGFKVHEVQDLAAQ
jgi:hypothetical protein